MLKTLSALAASGGTRSHVQRAVLLALLAASHGVGAQTAPATPDAGSLLQQRQLPPRPAPGADKAPSLQTPSQPLSLPAGTQVQVQRFDVLGNTLVPTDRLLAALAAYQGRRLSLAELQRAAAAVSEVYSQAGLLARTFLPPQDVTDGVIRLQVEEARFGAVSVTGAAQRFDASRAAAYVAAQQASGEPVNLVRLERALILLAELPGFDAKGSLAAGQAAGQTDLVIALSDTPLLTGEASLDNQGSRSTGAARATLGLGLNGLLGLGDSLAGTLSASQGNQYARFTAGLPLGVQGWRIGASASWLRYKLIGSDFAALLAEGSSQTQGIDLGYPLLRSGEANAQLQLGAERKQFDNQANGATASHYSSRVVTLGLTGSLYDGLAGGGANSASLLLSSGTIDLQGSPNAAADAAAAATQGSFNKLRYSASRLQQISPQWSVYALLTGQTSGSKNLDSSEKFYLGGPQGVRAYAVNEAGGSRGQLVNLELRAQLADGLRASAFYDWGQVRVNPRNGFTGAPRPNDITLQGVGASLGWAGPAALDLRLTLARRIGNNPAANTLGRDQDGSLTRNRLWLQAGLPF